MHDPHPVQSFWSISTDFSIIYTILMESLTARPFKAGFLNSFFALTLNSIFRPTRLLSSGYF
jgi:hypothetical protein